MPPCGTCRLGEHGHPAAGETVLIAAAVIAGTSNALNIWFVIAAAAGGVMLGDTVGFWTGREFGYRLVLGYGCYISLTESGASSGSIRSCAATRSCSSAVGALRSCRRSAKDPRHFAGSIARLSAIRNFMRERIAPWYSPLLHFSTIVLLRL